MKRTPPLHAPRSALRLALLSAAVLASGCGACFDLQAPRPYACDPRSLDPSACPGGYRCGAAGRCFDPATDAGAQLACTPAAAQAQNPQCPDGWACGVGGRCVDVRADRLVGADTPAPEAELLSPLLSSSAQLDSTLSPQVSCGAPTCLEVAALLLDGEAATLALIRSVERGPSSNRSPRTAFDIQVNRSTLPRGARSAVAWTTPLDGGSRVTLAALTDDGNRLQFSSAAPWRSVLLPRPAARLRALRGPTDDTALLAITFVDGSAELRALEDLEAATPVALPGPIADVLAMDQVGTDGGVCRALVASAGTQLCAAAFERGKDGGLTFQCTRAGPLSGEVTLKDVRPRTGFSAGPPGWFAARVVPAREAPSLQAFRLRAQGEACVAAPALDRGVSVADACPGADAGAPTDFRAIPLGAGARLERLCAGQFFDISVLDDDGREAVGLQSAAPRAGEGLALFSGLARAVSYGTDSRARVPLELSSTPELLFPAGVLGPPGRLLASAGAAFFLEAPDAGMLVTALASPEEALTAAVQNAANTFVLASGLVVHLDAASQPVVLAFDAEAIADPARVRATLVGDTLVVARGDALLSASVGDQVQLLEVRVKPQPGVDIVDLALRAAGDGGLPEGYLVAGGRAFAVRSRSERSWTSSPVELGDLEVQRVWFDGQRARAGTVDGRVLSLEGRVELAPQLPSEAVDWAAPCAAPWALTNSGLFRAVGTPVHWEEVPVALTMPGLIEASSPPERFKSAGLEAGRLFLVDNDVVVAGPFGQLVRYRARCP